MSDLSYLQATTIGLLQGVTELFPISSLGHSVLVPAWIGGSWRHLVTEQSASGDAPYLTFIVAVHCATALALVVYYAGAWVRIVGGLLTSIRDRRIATTTQRLAWLIVLATIPAGILGLALEHELRTVFAKPVAAAAFLIGNGVVLMLGEQLRRRSQAAPTEVSHRHSVSGSQRVAEAEALVITRVGVRDAIAVGVAQSGALLAGISRSGVTMVAGLFRGLDRESAANFAFLLATPIILAAGIYKLPELAQSSASGIRGPTLAGALVAGLAAYAAIRFLTRYFENRGLTPFAIYCLLFGVASIVRFG
ncbi:MAG TPA: undecaprenyl-diphosphate phosphatase [Mycobacteriales bacterium]|nr:undecaprenyl-diphosphate phosphatase [Mycobacteriales bacterium]